jgi:hypothetical protein
MRHGGNKGFVLRVCSLGRRHGPGRELFCGNVWIPGWDLNVGLDACQRSVL